MRSQSRIRFVLEVGEKGADLGFVSCIGFWAERFEGSLLDCSCAGEDCGGFGRGEVAESVVDEADTAVASGLVGLCDVDLVFLEVTLVWGHGEGWFFRRRSRRCSRVALGPAAFLFLYVITPFLDNLSRQSGDFGTLVLFRPVHHHSNLRGAKQVLCGENSLLKLIQNTHDDSRRFSSCCSFLKCLRLLNDFFGLHCGRMLITRTL